MGALRDTKAVFEDDEVCDLLDDELTGVAGGGQSGGPICPVCHSTNVVFDRNRHVVLHCNDCGYTAK